MSSPTSDVLLRDLSLLELASRAIPILSGEETVSTLPAVELTSDNWLAAQDMDGFEVLDRPEIVLQAIGDNATVSVFRAPQRFDRIVLCSWRLFGVVVDFVRVN